MDDEWRVAGRDLPCVNDYASVYTMNWHTGIYKNIDIKLSVHDTFLE